MKQKAHLIYSGSAEMYQIKRELLDQDSHMQLSVQPYIPKELENTLEPILENFMVLSQISRGSYGAVFKVALKSDYDMEMGMIPVRRASPKRKGKKKKKKGKSKKRIEIDGIGKERFALKMFFPLMSYQMMEMEMIFNFLMTQAGVCPPLCGGVPRLEEMTFMLSEFEESDSFHAMLDTMSEEFIACYMFEMLKGIYMFERMGIMHRDLKPSNFLYSHKTRRGYITDYGLAEIVFTYHNYPLNQEEPLIRRIYELQKQAKIYNRYGTRGYMAPEVVFNQYLQGTAVDVWSAGVTMLSMMTRHHPNLLPVDRENIPSDKVKDVLPFVCLFGYEGAIQLAKFYEVDLEVPEFYQDKGPMNFKEIVAKDFSEEFQRNGVDLMEKIFTGDWTRRCKAEEALAHDFFKEVRGRQLTKMFEE